MLIKNLAKNYLNNKKNRRIKQILDIASFDLINNINPTKVETIGFVVPTLRKFVGGHTSIIRLCSLLVDKGFNVAYISYENQPIAEMESVINTNYSHAKGCCLSYDDAKEMSFDLIVATNWISVYWAKQLNGYKAYFVQDYEPYFYMVDEEYELAKETYELGLHVISLGKWNLDQINKNCINKGKQSFISFPYEPVEYQFVKKDFNSIREKNKIKIAVYTKENGKRMANLLQYLLLDTKKELKKRGIELEVVFFGLNSNYRVIVGDNLGKLSKNQMHELYVESDFGIVASMTNISLVPFEMIGTGLPVIEFENGSFLSFLPREAAILINFDSKSFADKLLYYINNPEQLTKMTMTALNCVKDLSWNNTCDEFINIINSEIIN